MVLTAYIRDWEYTVVGLVANLRQNIQEWTSEICGALPLKNLKWYGLLKADHTPSYFLKAALPSTNLTWSILEYFAAFVTRRTE